MSARDAVLPLAAGVAVAAVTFAAVSVATSGGARATAPRARPPAVAAAPVPSAARPGRAVFARMGCGGCHVLAAAGSSGAIGPSLDGALAGHTPRSLRAEIADPGASSTMPGDFARRLTARDLDALVRFLLATRRPVPER